MATFEDQVRAWKTRLNELKLKQAWYGISGDPSISIEIEDIERKLSKANDAQHTLGLINQYRRNVQILMQQAAMHGAAYVPQVTVNSLRDARAKIAELKAGLFRTYNITVDDLPEDFEAKSTSPVHMSESPDIWGALDEGLEELANLLQEERYLQAKRYIRTLKALVAQGRHHGA